VRGSITASTSPFFTSWPSRKFRLISWPPTCGLTVTVFIAVTVPSALAYTGTSWCVASTTVTGTGPASGLRRPGAPPLPTGLVLAPADDAQADHGQHQNRHDQQHDLPNT
jgi:hypothetical protein